MENNSKQNNNIENWSEGNVHLKNLLLSCIDNNVQSMYSCAGHGKKKPAYITLKMDESTIPKIYNIIKSLHEKDDISYRFAQKEYGKDASFTVYMAKENLRESNMDTVSEALSREAKLDELPNNLRTVIKLSEIFRTNEIEYDLEYSLGKKRNLTIDNLKFADKVHLYNEDFKSMGFKIKKDLANNPVYQMKGLKSGAKEQTMLNSILSFVSKRYPKKREDSFFEELHDMKKDVEFMGKTSELTKINEKQKDVKEIG